MTREEYEEKNAVLVDRFLDASRGGIRCECGANLPLTGDMTLWRWNGELWQHRHSDGEWHSAPLDERVTAASKEIKKLNAEYVESLKNSPVVFVEACMSDSRFLERALALMKSLDKKGVW